MNDERETRRVAVITAATKGLGRASADALARAGYAVAICARNEDQVAAATAEIERLGVPVFGVTADVGRPDDLERLFALVDERYGRLDVLVSNAGGPPPGAFAAVTDEQWASAFELTLMSAVRSFRLAIERMQPNGFGRLLLIGSGEMYGQVARGVDADEQTTLLPTSPYAASKVAAEALALQFHRSYGTQVICARPFNHIGPGQDAGFVVPAFAAQVAAISRQQVPPILKVGNLSPERDFLHVLDVVAAYRLLLTKGEPGGVYNVCSGAGLRIEQLLELMLQVAGVQASLTDEPMTVHEARRLEIREHARLGRLDVDRRACG